MQAGDSISHASPRSNGPAGIPAGTLRVDALDGLRGVLALVVLLHHALLRLAPGADIGSTSPIDYFLPADFAVRVFFAHSGFVVSLRFLATHDPASPVAMVIRRPLRLGLPVAAAVFTGFALVVAFPFDLARWSAAMGGYNGDFDSSPTFPDVLLDAGGRTLLTGSHSLPGGWWTMPIELYCSVALLIGLAVMDRFSVRVRLFALGAYVAVLGALIVVRRAPIAIYPANIPDALLRYTVSFVPFLGGAALAQLWIHHHEMFRPGPDSVTHRRGRIAVLVAAPVGLAIGFLPSVAGRLLPGRPVWLQVDVGLAAVAVVAGFLCVPFLLRIFTRVPFGWLGRISFSLYLIHSVVQHTVMTRLVLVLLDAGVPQTVAIVAGAITQLVVSLALADLLTRTVERAALQWGKPISRKWAQDLSHRWSPQADHPSPDPPGRRATIDS